MQFDTHGNGNGLDDLYILPDTPEEAQQICTVLSNLPIRFTWKYSDVEGQEWYGKRFIVVPFGETWQKLIEKLYKEGQ